jgi:hypothetical protein
MDAEAMRTAYRHALSHGAKHGSVMLGLEVAKERLLLLVEAGERLAQALEKNTNPDDPEVAAALKNWNALR